MVSRALLVFAKVRLRRLGTTGVVLAVVLSTHQVPPVYPEEAKRVGLQGTVRLTAIIGTDGSVEDLKVIEGRCSLAQAAASAVRKWRYTPTLILGQPVRVVTTIDVNFALSQRRF